MKRLLIALALTGCSATTIVIPRAELAPETAPVGRHVHGEDCSGVVFGGAVREISARTAIEHALEGTGQTALRNVRITTFERGIALAGERCVSVSGFLEQ